MKKKILITSFDLAIGGVERSLIGLLNRIDYDKYDVDLLLFKQEGEFMPFIPKGPHLLPEIPKYATFRKSVSDVIQDRFYPIALARILGKYSGALHGKLKRVREPGYLNIQYGWAFAKPFLPKLDKEYDAAIGFLWPHYFIGEKVKAKKKIGWVHTDYSNIFVNKQVEAGMWRKLDQIVAVSDECLQTFLGVFPEFEQKTSVIENILSPAFIRKQAAAYIPKEMAEGRGKYKIVTVGRLTYAKGLDDAIKACRTLVDAGFDIEWFVVGYGPLKDELETLIAKLGLEKRFILLGKKVNPYPYILAADLYVQPSRYEGKAVTIREAQILGKPVLITNFPTAASQARDGVDACICGTGSEGIAEGIKLILADGAFRKKLINQVQGADYGNETEIRKVYELIDS